MKRRDFVRACAAAAGGAALPTPSGAAALTARMYSRAKLVDARGDPLRAASLAAGRNYVFDYPYASTPCFLLRLRDRPATAVDLKTESGSIYRWEGGVGPGRDLVAYSAICAHKMTYPTKQVSFIGYRDDPSPAAGRGRVIACCSDRSVYDPAAGAKVVSGPAPQPLCTILLEHDPKADELHALGTFGGEMFAEFFRKYEFRLQLEQGPRARNAVEGTAVVRELETYSTQWAKC
jgi:arsenite oxidase small subunit